MKAQATWTNEYEINSLLLNPHQRLGLFGLLNLLQDTAWNHAHYRGHGFEDTKEKGLIWALTRQKLHMNHWPKWRDQVRICTWVRPINSPFASRDFEIYQGDKKIGESTTSWLTLDLKTRKPKRVNPAEYDMIFKEDGCLTIKTEKIEIQKELLAKPEFHSAFRVRNSDLDVNGHVNNTRYAQWVLDAIPFERHSHRVVEEYEVNFLAETHAEDEIEVQGEYLNGSPKIQFQGYRKADQKVVFTSRMKTGLIDI